MPDISNNLEAEHYLPSTLTNKVKVCLPNIMPPSSYRFSEHFLMIKFKTATTLHLYIKVLNDWTLDSIWRNLNRVVLLLKWKTIHLRRISLKLDYIPKFSTWYAKKSSNKISSIFVSEISIGLSFSLLLF